MRPAVTRTSPKSLAPWDAAPNARRASYQNWALSGNSGGLLSDTASACSTFEDCAPAFEPAAVAVNGVSAFIKFFRFINHTSKDSLNATIFALVWIYEETTSGRPNGTQPGCGVRCRRRIVDGKRAGIYCYDRDSRTRRCGGYHSLSALARGQQFAAGGSSRSAQPGASAP